LSSFFGEDRLALVVVVLSINSPVKGVAGVSRDVLRRELMFKELALGAGGSLSRCPLSPRSCSPLTVLASGPSSPTPSLGPLRCCSPTRG
jgi:hypothetical protein